MHLKETSHGFFVSFSASSLLLAFGLLNFRLFVDSAIFFFFLLVRRRFTHFFSVSYSHKGE